jgi:hypothetical protein
MAGPSPAMIGNEAYGYPDRSRKIANTYTVAARTNPATAQSNGPGPTPLGGVLHHEDGVRG